MEHKATEGSGLPARLRALMVSISHPPAFYMLTLELLSVPLFVIKPGTIGQCFLFR